MFLFCRRRKELLMEQKLEKKLKQNIPLDYITVFITNLNMQSSIWMLYLAYCGLDLAEIGIIEGIYHATSIICEIPSGAVADLLGRKRSMVFSRACTAVSCIVMLFSESFWWFAVGFAVQALGNNLNSGSEEALVYDSMKYVGQEKGYLKVCGKLDVILEVSQGIATVLGGILAEYSYFCCYSACLAIALLALLPVLLMAEAPNAETDVQEYEGHGMGRTSENPKNEVHDVPACEGHGMGRASENPKNVVPNVPAYERHGIGEASENPKNEVPDVSAEQGMDGAKEKQLGKVVAMQAKEGAEKGSPKKGQEGLKLVKGQCGNLIGKCKETVCDVVKQHFRVSCKILKSDVRILKIIVYYSVVSAAETLLFFYSQQYYYVLGYSKVSISLILLAVGVASCLGAALSGRLFRKWGSKMLKVAAAAIAFALICYGLQNVWLSVTVFVAAGFFNSVLYPIKSDVLNQLIPSRQRATLISVDSMFFSVTMIGMFPVAGVMADKWGLAAVLAGIGFLLMVFAVCWHMAEGGCRER